MFFFNIVSLFMVSNVGIMGNLENSGKLKMSGKLGEITMNSFKKFPIGKKFLSKNRWFFD